MGAVPDGLYSFAGNAVRILRNRTAHELRQIRRIVEQVSAGEMAVDEAGAEIERVAPGAGVVAALLSNRGAASAAWLAVLLALLMYLAPRDGGDPATPPNTEVEVDVEVRVDGQGPSEAEVAEIVETILAEKLPEVLEIPVTPSTTLTVTPGPAYVVKTPRNAPCPCGSGKKFKKCHGGAADE
jgi:hypothetical protein